MKIRVTIPTPASDFEKVMKALDESHGHLTREEAAVMVHLSPAQFSRQFKRLTGTRFREAQVAMKIRRGASLLVNTNLQIRKIADLLAYSEPAKFQKTFRRILGVNPSQYRMQMAKVRDVC